MAKGVANNAPHPRTQQRLVKVVADGGAVRLQLLEGRAHAVKAGGLPHKLHAVTHHAVIRHILKGATRCGRGRHEEGGVGVRLCFAAQHKRVPGMKECYDTPSAPAPGAVCRQQGLHQAHPHSKPPPPTVDAISKHTSSHWLKRMTVPLPSHAPRLLAFVCLSFSSSPARGGHLAACLEAASCEAKSRTEAHTCIRHWSIIFEQLQPSSPASFPTPEPQARPPLHSRRSTSSFGKKKYASRLLLRPRSQRSVMLSRDCRRPGGGRGGM